MQIAAKILADSCYGNHRITSFELYYHRYILPEINTHRAISKNGQSSRAIPTEKLIELCLSSRVEPVQWGLDQSGMQAFTVADEILERKGRQIWDDARLNAVQSAIALNGLGFAKQIVNRVLEPFLPTRTVMTGTDWNNFFTLRDHKDAQPEFRDLAAIMRELMRDGSPKTLDEFDWHRPYMEIGDLDRAERQDSLDVLDECIDLIDTGAHPFTSYFRSSSDLLLNMTSSARCARASYRTVEGKPTDFDLDLTLFKRLVKTQPVHASPTEHQAIPAVSGTPTRMTANFTGFIPFRRLIKNETIWG
jgi:hypothetical protein